MILLWRAAFANQARLWGFSPVPLGPAGASEKARTQNRAQGGGACAAGRLKDLEFAAAVLKLGLARAPVLRARIAKLMTASASERALSSLTIVLRAV